MKRVVSMIVGASAVMTTLVFVGPLGAPGWARQDSSEASSKKSAASGRQLFSRNCARCHGARGQGKNGPKLAGKSLGQDQIEETVTNGRSPKMPAFGKQLSSAEIKAVAAYVSKL
jgi:cytochrome c oxidase cbb3-type subunit 3